MKTIPLLAALALISALRQDISAQAITSTAQVTQQSMQNVGSSTQQPNIIHLNTAAPPQAKPGPVQPFYDVNRFSPDCQCAKLPVFSLKTGEISPGTQISITSSTPNATIYYTNDGWTPTTASTRYIGPITILGTTRLQAIAVESSLLPSPVVEANYTVDAPAPTPQPDAFAVGTVMVKGTPIRLLTASRINSLTASVGDRVYLLLDQNIVSGGVVMARRGVSVDAKIVKVEKAGHSGKPGLLALQVQSFTVRDITVPISGIFTLVGPDVASQTQRISNPSMVRVSGPMPDGNEAQIEPGATLIATVAINTTLNP